MRWIRIGLPAVSVMLCVFAACSDDDTATTPGTTPTPEASTSDVATPPDDARTLPALIATSDPSQWVGIAANTPATTVDADNGVLYNGRPTGRMVTVAVDAGSADAGTDAGDGGIDDLPWAGSIARASWDVTPYLGHRVRMTGYLKTESAQGATLWLRFDHSPTILLLANGVDPVDRSVKGTNDFTKFENVVDIPTAATGQAIFGALLYGATGSVWIGEVTFEEVGTDVPVTPSLDEAELAGG